MDLKTLSRNFLCDYAHRVGSVDFVIEWYIQYVAVLYHAAKISHQWSILQNKIVYDVGFHLIQLEGLRFHDNITTCITYKKE